MRNKKQRVLRYFPPRQIVVPDSPLIHLGLLEAPRLAGFALENSRFSNTSWQWLSIQRKMRPTYTTMS